MTFVQYFLAFIPALTLYWLIDWEIAYYTRYGRKVMWRKVKDPRRIRVYLVMFAMAIGWVLTSIPFILLIDISSKT